MIFLFPLGGICDRFLEGKFTPNNPPSIPKESCLSLTQFALGYPRCSKAPGCRGQLWWYATAGESPVLGQGGGFKGRGWEELGSVSLYNLPSNNFFCQNKTEGSNISQEELTRSDWIFSAWLFGFSISLGKRKWWVFLHHPVLLHLWGGRKLGPGIASTLTCYLNLQLGLAKMDFYTYLSNIHIFV